MAKTIKFPHAVIYNGKFYYANSPINVADEEAKEKKPSDQGEGKQRKRGSK